jgi:hypothetical protein
MAKKTRNTLKGFFETGKKPTEGQYANLIDSHLILDGENTGSLNLKGNVVVRGEITASGNISSSGNIIADQFIGDGRLITGLTSSLITVSTVTASVATGSLIISGTLYHPSASTNILVGLKTTGSIIPGRDGLFDVGSPTHYFKDSFVSKSHSNVVTTTNLIATEGTFTNITASGNISSSGTIQGANLIATSLKNNSNENLIRYHAASDSVRVGIHTDNTNPLSLQGHVTASGNVSASGDIYSNNIELGHPTDTTIARSAAGVVTIEGNQIVTQKAADVGSEQQGPIAMRVARRTITQAELNNMHNTPIPIIPAQGANTIIVPTECILKVDRAATQTTANSLVIGYDSPPFTNSIFYSRRFMMNTTTDQTMKINGYVDVWATNLTTPVNTVVDASFTAAMTTNCFTSIDVYITYYVLDVS